MLLLSYTDNLRDQQAQLELITYLDKLIHRQAEY